jgi:hypothetical protein
MAGRAFFVQKANGISDSVVPVGGVNTLDEPVQLRHGVNAFIRCTSITLNSNMPNIFTWKTFTNQSCRIKTSTQPWTTIRVPTGTYQVSDLSAALNSKINALGWWANATVPGMVLEANFVSNEVFCTIDSTKLAAGKGNSFQIDFSFNGASTYMGRLLGFSDAACPLGNGSHSNDITPKLDTQGIAVKFSSPSFPPCPVNSKREHIIDFVATDQQESNTSWAWPPPGGSAPSLLYVGPRQITQLQIDTEGGRSDETPTSGFPALVQPLGEICRVTVEFHT